MLDRVFDSTTAKIPAMGLDTYIFLFAAVAKHPDSSKRCRLYLPFLFSNLAAVLLLGTNVYVSNARIKCCSYEETQIIQLLQVAFSKSPVVYLSKSSFNISVNEKVLMKDFRWNFQEPSTRSALYFISCLLLLTSARNEERPTLQIE